MAGMKNNTSIWIAIVCIVLVAIFLRFFQLGLVPVSLYWDETAMLLDAKVLAATGKDMHGNSWLQSLFPSYGDYKLPVYIWLATLSVKLFGVSDFALRLPSALAGVGSVIVVGLLGYQLANLNQPTGTKTASKVESHAVLTGLLTATIMAVTPWSILFSRTGFEGHVGQFLAGASILCALCARKNRWWLLASVLLGSVATYTYFSVRFVWPVVFVMSSALVMVGTVKISDLVRFNRSVLTKLGLQIVMVLGCLGLYVLTLQPMLNSPLYAESTRFRLSTSSIFNAFDYPVMSNILREQAGNSFIDRVFFHRHVLMIRELMKNYADNLDPSYLFVTGDPNLRHGTCQHGLLLLPTAPLLVWGIFALAKRRPAQLVVLLSWWMVALLPASVPEGTPHALRSLNALMPVILILGVGAAALWQWLREKSTASSVVSKKMSWYFVALVVIGSFIVATASFSYHYFSTYPNQSAFDWQDGYRQLTTTILENQDSVRTVWVNPFEDRFYLWLLTYGPYTAAEIQALEKTNYKVTAVDKVVFDHFEWGKLGTLDHRVLVVGQPDSIEEQLQKSTQQPAKTIPIMGHDGVTERFRAVVFEPNI